MSTDPANPTPDPSELDARVDAALRELDQAHDRVKAQLDGTLVPEDAALDAQLTEALSATQSVASNPPPKLAEPEPALSADELASLQAQADAEAQARAQESAPPALEQADLQAPDAGAPVATAVDEPGGLEASIAPDPLAGAAPPAADAEASDSADSVAPATVAELEQAYSEPPSQTHGPDRQQAAAPKLVDAPTDPHPSAMPVAAHPAPEPSIKELDERLAKSASVADVEDDFADASDVLAGRETAAPPSGQIELPPAPPAPVAPVAPVAAAPVAPAPVANAETPAPAPVAHTRPVAPVLPKPPPAPPAPVPAAKPVAPAAPLAAPKPARPSLADIFWRVATPIVEPLAIQLGRLPVRTQHTFGWIGMTTLFMGATTWAYVLFFMDSRPPSQIALERAEQRASQREKAGVHDDENDHAPAKPSSKAPAKADHGGGH